MLNKIVVLIFVGTISAASTVALASDDGARSHSNKSHIISNANSSKNFEKQIEKVESQDTLSQGSNADNTVWPKTGWLLSIALFGFVMLSNRSSI
jgi:hypothetical protein